MMPPLNIDNDMEVLNLCKLSDTFPQMPSLLLPRSQYVELFERQLTENDIIFVPGEEGYGVTTTLAQFALQHAGSCFSYFVNELEVYRFDEEIMESSLSRQMNFYINMEDSSSGTPVSYASLLMPTIRTSKKYGDTIYVVLDGFDRTPLDKKAQVRHFFERLPWRQAKFIFSGEKEKYLDIIPNLSKFKTKESNTIMSFTNEEVSFYFHSLCPEISVEETKALQAVTGGVAVKMDIIARKYAQTHTFNEYLNIDETGVDDLNDLDYNKIIDPNNPVFENLLALIAFSQEKLNTKAVCEILNWSENELSVAIKHDKAFIFVKGDYIVFNTENGHRYIRRKLSHLKEQIEIFLIDYYEHHPEASLDFLPALYKDMKRNDKLIEYLNSDTVQSILEQRRSQAALNVQCTFGFEACSNDTDRFDDSFRFALYKSSSLEQEKIELWNNEIEALIAIGNYDQALELSQNIYIEEERLKSYAIIAKHQAKTRGFVEPSLLDVIKSLCNNIDFPNIPDKSVELAKLLIHVDFTLSLQIIDQVTLADERRDPDRIYSLLTLTLADDFGKSSVNSANYDLLTSKIHDSELLSFSQALKTLFEDNTAEYVIKKVKELPKNSQKLFLLSNWIEENKSKKDIDIAVKYAIELVIASSNEKQPKASYLATICTALPYIEVEKILPILTLLESIDASIQYPSRDYTKVQLKVIEAVSKYDQNKAVEKLNYLHIGIGDLKGLSTQIECEAMILRDYEQLGDKRILQKEFMSEYELQQKVNIKIRKLLSESAYHYKDVEGIIRVLVCSHPSIISDTIKQMNTHSRQHEAYLLAASEYIRQTDIDKIKWDYLKLLIDQIDFPADERVKPIRQLLRKCVRNHRIAEKFLTQLKKYNEYFESVQSPGHRCELFSDLYVLFNNKEFSAYADSIYTKLMQTWEKLQDKRIKIDTGYMIAYIISKTSPEKAAVIVRKTIEVQEHYFLSSSSCAVNFDICLELYVRTLGLLIRSDCYEDEYLKEFERIVAQSSSPGLSISLWSQICLNFYLSNKNEEFLKYFNEKVLVSFDKYHCSEQTRTRIICIISPSLYFYNTSLFYSLIKPLHQEAKTYCIDTVVRVVILQHPDILDLAERQGAYEMTYDRYLMICDLLSHLDDDDTIFQIIDLTCRCMEQNINRKISLEQKRDICSKLKIVALTKLPDTINGIKHDGYQIASLISIESLENKRRKKDDWADFAKAIDDVPNLADQSFLYIHLGEHVSYRPDQENYYEKGFKLALKLSSRYDKTQRMKMGLTECKGNKSVFAKLLKIAYEDTIKDKNGSLSDFSDLIDSAQQYDDKLAENLIDQLDQDPARLHYKEKLRKDLIRRKKIKDATDNKDNISRLNQEEYSEYFKNQLVELVAGRCTIWKIDQLNKLVPLIFRYPIKQSINSVFFIMENLHQKKKKNNENVNIHLTKLYHASLWNLKIMLSLATDTKDKLERLNNTIIQSHQETSSSIRPGNREKAVQGILRWYKSYPYRSLKIIDAYFRKEDLQIVKLLFNINNQLQVRILTHRRNVIELTEYQNYWNDISSDMTGGIFINTVRWADNPDDGPLHDRWWILEDRKAGKHGIKMTSLSSLGKKEVGISNMTDSEIQDQYVVWEDYICEMPSINGRTLIYDRIRIK